MSRLISRRYFFPVLATTCLAGGGLTQGAYAHAVFFNIGRMPISRAIVAYGNQANARIVLADPAQQGIAGNAVRGSMDSVMALDQLLSGTGLAVLSRRGDVIVVGRMTSATHPAPRSSKKNGVGALKAESVMVHARRDTVSTKRYAAQIVDTLSAEQMRTAPDLTVVEAARRIVGISVMPSTDDNRSDNNIENITIRGLNNSYNLITIDGAQLASANNTYRGARLDLIPSSMLGELQVLKTIDAYNDPQGIGGQVNMVTKNAFDYGNSFDTQLLGGWNNLAGSVVQPSHENWRVDGALTRVFGKHKEFGFVLSGNYQELHSATHAILPGDSTGDGWNYYAASGTSVGSPTNTDAQAATGSAVPVRSQDYAFDDAYRRYSLTGKFQYRPSHRFDLSVFGGYFHTFDQETRNEALSMPSGTWTQGDTPNTGSVTQGQYQFGITQQPETQRTWFVNGKIHYDINDHMHLNFLASDSIAWDDSYRTMIKYNTGMNENTNKTTYQTNYGYSYSVDNGAPVISLNDLTSANNPDNYNPRYWRFYGFHVKNNVRFLRGDWRWEAGRGFWMNAGVTQTMTHVTNSETYTQWIPKDAVAAAEIGNMDQVLASKTLTMESAPGLKYFTLDYQQALNRLLNNKSLFKTTNTLSTTKPAYYRLQESITAAYFQTGWHNRFVSLQGGFRWDHTRASIGNFDGITQDSATDYVFQTRGSGYDYLLPSVLATFNVTPTMKLRAAFTETVGRPNYGNYGAATSTTFDGATVNISQGNPNLKPRHAWNYDLSYEWYPQKDTILSVGLFYKDIHDEIYTRTSYGSVMMDGASYAAVISEPLNAQGAGLRGVEMQIARQRFGFLPGILKNFGVSFNATFLQGFYEETMDDGSQRRVNGLSNQPSHIYNASLFYADKRLEARVAYNRIGKSLYSTSGTARWQDMWLQERGQLDLQASYRFFKWLSATGQVQNLTGEGYVTRMGPRENLIQDRHPAGRSVWLGLRFQPDF
ncbi:TonB-dependent receptor [Gluconobacter kanchanaburiensis]|uniref:TonB-dependent receptor n=1 Tax=Gluconobacter kanchanaburiensis TaxID=563199 RepID=UPI0011BF001F|nr:TonB-dependent receptor [Gluconobacter kanchanaburiensis]MBF0862942.1 TonB-dependent receptor [Gluconobacter kanchanaburiensis]